MCVPPCPLAETPDADAVMDLEASEEASAEVLYDCVICGQSGPSTEDRPTGLVVLLQASSGEMSYCTLNMIKLGT